MKQGGVVAMEYVGGSYVAKNFPEASKASQLKWPDVSSFHIVGQNGFLACVED